MLSKTYTKYIQSLHHKKFRDLHNVFIAEGSKVVMDLLRSGKIVCDHILANEEWLTDYEDAIKDLYKGPVEMIKDYDLEKISALTTPNKVLGVFKKMSLLPVDPTGKITLLLDTIQDPGNLGTITRIADWFGVPLVVCSENCADLYNPKVVQSTMGSIARVGVVYTNLVAWLQKYPTISVYAATLNGRNVNSVSGLKEAVLLIGNESKGISGELMQKATEKITIPRTGGAESLNAAVATGIILSHMTAVPAFTSTADAKA